MEHVEIVCAEFFLFEGLVLFYVILVDDQSFLEAGVDQELNLVLNEGVDRLKIRLSQS